jgi:uncharacterized iron-regulated membrane protein
MARSDPLSSSTSALYRAIWRWHFYAGVIVAPILLVMAITGSIYLFNTEIDDGLNHDRRFVTVQGPAMPVSHWIAAAQKAQPGAVTSVDFPATPDRAAEISIKPAAGEPVQVAVEPATMRVLGSYVTAQTLTGIAREIHRSLIIGTLGRGIVEIAACWALVLVVTGIYLWWPRGIAFNLGGVFFPRLRLRGRLLWKDFHVVTGVWTCVLIAFMILSGLPWAGVQGVIFRQGVTAAGIGYPARNAQSVPMKAVLKETPWTLQDAAMPQSSPEHAGHAGHDMANPGSDAAAVAGVDAVVKRLKAHGLSAGYRLTLPVGPKGVYTASTYPDQPQGQRTLHFDRYSGKLIREIRYADYGWGAKAIELGVQLHMGNYFGRANQIVMLIPCLGIILLVITGITMWWKRRPAGKLAAPPKVPQARLKGAMVLMGLAGLAMPLFGASLVAVAALDGLTHLTRRTS